MTGNPSQYKPKNKFKLAPSAKTNEP